MLTTTNTPLSIITHSATPDFDNVVMLWLGRYAKTTAENYRRDLYQFLAFVGEVNDFRLIPAHIYAAYGLYLQNECGYKPRTTRRKLAALSSFCKCAFEVGYMKANPTVVIRKPKVSSTLAGRRLTEKQVWKLIDGCEDLRNRTLMKTLYALGLRISEACSLNWGDFHIDSRGKITVSVLGKGDKRRTLVVPPALWLELEVLRGTQTHSNDNDAVFQTYSNRYRKQSGKRLDRTNAHRVVKQAVLECGLPENVSCHWLRHANAFHALANGASLPLVRDSLGHSNISTTNAYLETDPEDCTSLYIKL